MPYKDPERGRQRHRERYQENRDARIAKQKAYYLEHTDTYKARSAAWYKNNPEKARAHWLRQNLKKFNLTPEQYQAMVAQQGGVCAICSGLPHSGVMGSPKRLSVDHNHTTNENRGLLCGNCNRGIGVFRESPERLELAAAYLRKWANLPV